MLMVPDGLVQVTSKSGRKRSALSRRASSSPMLSASTISSSGYRYGTTSSWRRRRASSMYCPTVSSAGIGSSWYDDCLRQCLPVQDLVAIDLQAAEQRAECHLGTQRLDLVDLRRKRQSMLGSRVEHPLASGQGGGSAGRQQVRHVDRKPIDHAQPAVPEDRHAVAGQRRVAQFRHLDLAGNPRRDHHPATGLRDVLLVEHLPETHQQIDDLNLARRPGRVANDDILRRSGGTKIAVLGNGAGGGTLVPGIRLAKQTFQHLGIDNNLELLGGVVR